MIPIAKPLIGAREKELVMEVLDSGVIAQGPKVGEFEERFAGYIGVKHAVAATSGTTALHLALMAHGIKAGDEVITTPFTFIASANSILHANARPVFADIKEETFNIDPEKVREKITAKTKALMPVHLYGNPCEMEELMEIAEEHDLAVIEDACQAHGAEVSGKKTGSFSTGTFSFYPTKNMTTGEGGMASTDDDETYEKLRMLREHGAKVRYYHDILGYNYRMTDIAAAIGIAQLERLESFNESRIRNAKLLTEKLESVKGITTPKVGKNTRHVFHQYTIRVTDEYPMGRDELANFLKDKGIGTGVHYPLPIHKQALYAGLGYVDSLPVSEKAALEVLSLPVHPSVSEEDIGYIAKTIAEAGR
ncbi:MAG: DegT/DnrJ/EryC1/StrS family aminotransferase [Candidatus Altiarchaeota archaeon]|nr:DegT/DnrJ/EryC1/StrS family aminotransferase [Candidatus Altiarchaeota archaeon]